MMLTLCKARNCHLKAVHMGLTRYNHLLLMPVSLQSSLSYHPAAAKSDISVTLRPIIKCPSVRIYAV